MLCRTAKNLQQIYYLNFKKTVVGGGSGKDCTVLAPPHGNVSGAFQKKASTLIGGDIVL
jgi:hypothetical protein